MDWHRTPFEKYIDVIDKYVPDNLEHGWEADTKANQIATAVCFLINKWFHNRDIYDNTYLLKRECNDISCFANWLHKYTDSGAILEKIACCINENDYINLLIELSDKLLNENYLSPMLKFETIDCLFFCEGPFRVKDEWFEKFLAECEAKENKKMGIG